MRKFFVTRILLSVISIGLGITLQSCEETSVTSSIQPARLEGVIRDRATSIPIEKALVKLLPLNRTAETDASGKYAFSIELPDSNATTVDMVVSKSGFVSDTLVALVIKSNLLKTAPEIKLSRTGGNSGQSGDATNIVLINVSTSRIYVAGSGGQATADLTFEVRDANGIPVDLQHKATLLFKIMSGPGGGEAIAPATAVTNENGRAITTVTSGTLSGALQVVADIQGKPITAAPVSIAIHGGLPDKNHFSAVSEKLNFAGLVYYGLENRITAFVGDKFSNPVTPETSVQFRTTGGIIGGSAVTDAQGRASVVLTSANPVPPAFEGIRGLALIIAETVGENRIKLKDTTFVLFSGPTQPIGVTPATFILGPFNSKLFIYTVRDINNNPLVAGTSIVVSADNGATLAGDTNVTLRDTQSRAYTQFSFTLTNAQPDVVDKDANVTIKVSSPNGDASVTIAGKILKK